MRLLSRFFFLLFLAVLGLIGAGAAGLFGLWYFGRDLPDYQQLANYEPPVTTRLHAGDGRLIAEYSRERRLFVPIQAIPKPVIQAFLSAEDKNFYEHSGIDPMGIARAVVQNVANLAQSRRPVGASTITQQVAKNFLLGNEVSLGRKAKEAILAFRIEKTFSKDKILELYLNEIYLGAGAYGVAAAALVYFDKSLYDLTLPEAAYLAALPKAPSNYHPVRHHDRAKARRDWVIERLQEDGVINVEQARIAIAAPLQALARPDSELARADWFAEEVRRELSQKFGEKSLYEGGLSVRTTMDPKLQGLGERVLRDGLEAYDRRAGGWRGPLAKLPAGSDWKTQLSAMPPFAGILPPWRVAAVLSLDNDSISIGFADGAKAEIAQAGYRWARKKLGADHFGPVPRAPSEIVAVGDVIIASPLDPAKPQGAYALRQIPEIGGGLVAMDPHTGRVLALVGGYDFKLSQFNRATQANRQPGSAFKPFVYAAAIDNGFTPSSLVLDAPFVMDQGPGLPLWKPGNYSDQFYGPSTLRVGVEKSRNLMTVRLAQAIGMDKVSDYARRFGVIDNLQPVLAMSLGAGETTLMKMTTAYSEFVNGGKKITPTLIDRIQNRTGSTIYRHDKRPCIDCLAVDWHGQGEPALPDPRAQVLDAVTAYQITSILEGVVQRGTGIRIRELGKPLAGKTGTTNDSMDTWFVGFSPDLAVGVFIGYDTPKDMGKRETGSSVAVPVFKSFMAEALQGKPNIQFRVPPGVRLVRVQAETGELARPGDRNVILEAFRPGTEPQAGERSLVLDGSMSDDRDSISGVGASAGSAPISGTGGLY
ncbi:penicillin-binding protein 1A [Ferrovibrio terrae]|uniref:Penicillin-binding protein 1A n=1 Tax=Ferrovibrio terrae TaxID=2594003 RepID=A0A516H3C3_9PROT|nr:penicillin-binding protein 1A [Ferrovibrio terrae]QDO98278.1 penicillin-binding protein 1A [Ferrovibrio terrae]